MMEAVSWLRGALAVAAVLAVLASEARAGERESAVAVGIVELEVRPGSADPGISAFDYPHRVLYDRQHRDGDLLVFLVGTTERPGPGPQAFLRTALAQGYRVIDLVYISYPAVSQVCARERLRDDPGCAAHFRQRRLYGDIAFAGIPDRPADAIVVRLGKLLRYLVRTDPDGGWDRYLEDGSPRWSRIAIAGQSQGGGMAEYLGKRERLARVLAFSGGWDHAMPDGSPAAWYADAPATPPGCWYYAYHVEERFASQLAVIADLLRLPAGHVFALDEPLSARARRSRMPGHGSAISDEVYAPVWERMLGRGEAGCDGGAASSGRERLAR